MSVSDKHLTISVGLFNEENCNTTDKIIVTPFRCLTLLWNFAGTFASHNSIVSQSTSSSQLG